jgi:arabinose-5-phosphate isomerase
MPSRVTPLRPPGLHQLVPGGVETGEARLAQARAVLELEAAAIFGLAGRLDDGICRAADLILDCAGRVIVTGVGKSGHIARKIAATLSSAGTPSVFLHAGEAAHGDLGVAARGDVLLLLSNSGEVAELKRIVPTLRELGLPVIALVGRRESTLARWADVVLETAVAREACPHNLVPTASAIAALALGDALAMIIMLARGFTAEDFARLHPGGHLGRGLGCRVRDCMLQTDLPFVSREQSVGDSLVTMTRGRCGLAIVVDERHSLLGVVTDGDLRRALQQGRDLRHLPISEIMTSDPVTIDENAPLHEAQTRMQQLKLQALIVLDAQRTVSGVIQIFNGQ